MNNKKLPLLPLVAALCSAKLVYADGILPTETTHWHPVIGVGGGVAITTTLGESQTFPIQNSITDEYYVYSATNHTKAQGMFEVFLGTEHPVFSNYVLQGGLAYSQTGSYQAKGTFIQGADTLSQDQYNYHYNVIAREILAQAKLMRLYQNKFYPYVLLGLGGSFNKASNYTTNVPEFLTFTRDYANHTSSSFAYRVGLGMDMDITKHARVGLSYRFAGLGHADLGNTTINGISVSGSISQSNLYANEVLVQLTYVI